ncbi:BON domain-containing protein [Rhizobiales bacterium GAS113]|nr:BON domain-containing protein [Rhizobiales bacterium GAS113]
MGGRSKSLPCDKCRSCPISEPWGTVQMRNAMTNNVTEIRLDPNMAKTIEPMLRWQISGFPVVDALCRTLADILIASERQETPADTEIRMRISAQLDAQSGIPDALININVHDGIVELRGAIASQYHRQTLCAIAEGALGVKTVHDHLIWIDRNSSAFLLSPEDSAAANPGTSGQFNGQRMPTADLTAAQRKERPTSSGALSDAPHLEEVSESDRCRHSSTPEPQPC